ncbi:UNVERIFIED_CONTAM: hypothetical protein K2H54_055224 [Gekko kuhli]
MAEGRWERAASSAMCRDDWRFKFLCCTLASMSRAGDPCAATLSHMPNLYYAKWLLDEGDTFHYPERGNHGANVVFKFSSVDKYCTKLLKSIIFILLRGIPNDKCTLFLNINFRRKQIAAT